MKAVICTRYGPPEVLQLRDVKKPIPKEHEILIRIHASAVTSSDWFIRSGVPFAPLFFRIMLRLVLGISRPRQPILGMVLAGEVDQTGLAVTKFHAGDRVFAYTGFRFGAYAQYACLPESGVIAAVPSSITDEEAAAIPYGGLIAMHYLRTGDIGKARRVLIYGASGAVGTAAVQLAKHFGADVTAVCGSTNQELVRSLRADAVMDYTKQDAPDRGARYDLMFDAVGRRKRSALKVACREALAPNGLYVSVDDGRPALLAEDLLMLKSLVESGSLKPVIDRRYLLTEIVAAHRYVEQDHKKGNVIITVPHDAN